MIFLVEVRLCVNFKKKLTKLLGLILHFCAKIRSAGPALVTKIEHKLFFLELFGRPRDIPAKSRDIPPKKFDFPGFEGHTELFGPHPFVWKTPTPPENIRA